MQKPRLITASFCLTVWTVAASATILDVGPGKPFAKPSDAAAAARDGDTIRIAPAQYVDCAVLRQNDLTIEGTGAGVILTDQVCQGKALLVIGGNNVTVRNLTLQRARVSDHNGAGIRAEGGNLTIDHDRFLNNENGILSNANPQASIRITDSEFIGNGTCAADCAHGVYVGAVALLHIERSRFFATREGHHIKSRAMRTEIMGNDIEDGPEGTSSYLIDIPNGGSALVEGNTLVKGERTQNTGSAIIIGEEGVDRVTEALIFRNNHFTNEHNRSTIFVNNFTATPAQLTGNILKGQVRPLEGDGARE
jgi:hypothetical protein